MFVKRHSIRGQMDVSPSILIHHRDVFKIHEEAYSTRVQNDVDFKLHESTTHAQGPLFFQELFTTVSTLFAQGILK